MKNILQDEADISVFAISASRLNTIEAEKLVGKELIYLMEKNRSLLVNYYTSKGVIVVDNFYQIPDSCFVGRNWPTEHYNYQGKKIVAESIKNAIETNELHY